MALSFANDDNGNAPQKYIKLTLAANDGNGFQQKVDFNASSYSSSIFASDLSNINFQDGAGNLLYSWQETHAPTTSSTDVIYFVKLPNGTITDVYMVLVATNKSSYSTTHTGVEPTYSATYGQYDNGASVFSYYQQWGGLSALPTGWNLGGDTGNVHTTFNPAQTYINYTSTAEGEVYETAQSSMTTYPTIIEMYAQLNSDYTGWSVGSATNTYSGYGASAHWNNTYQTSTVMQILSDGNPLSSTTLPTVAGHVWTAALSSSTSLEIQIDYASMQGSPYSISSAQADTYFAFTFGDRSSYMYLYWLRTRAYPSGGTMPSITFSSATRLYAGLISYMA